MAFDTAAERSEAATKLNELLVQSMGSAHLTPELLAQPIGQLPLDERIKNALLNFHEPSVPMRTLQDVVTNPRINAVPDLGPAAFKKIHAFLEPYGLQLRLPKGQLEKLMADHGYLQPIRVDINTEAADLPVGAIFHFHKSAALKFAALANETLQATHHAWPGSIIRLAPTEEAIPTYPVYVADTALHALTEPTGQQIFRDKAAQARSSSRERG